MKEHKAETIEDMLKWWPELRKLTEHANVIGIRIVCRKGRGLKSHLLDERDLTSAFQFGELHNTPTAQEGE